MQDVSQDQMLWYMIIISEGSGLNS